MSSIRSATPEDFDGLRRVFRESDLQHSQALPQVFRAPEPGEPLRSHGYLLEALQQEHAVILVAEITTEIVGALHLSIRQAPDYWAFVPRQYAWIDNVVVAAQCRRRGIATALFTHAHQWAAERGVSQIELNVWNFNEDAIRFYESLGYETASRRMWMTMHQDASRKDQ
ncbi:MAG TPA: GNAT family N-acetyltransferase [Armatimonadota bacterium]|jgi:ribosomal protein S18 acetylase RimI-like enzyme